MRIQRFSIIFLTTVVFCAAASALFAQQVKRPNPSSVKPLPLVRHPADADTLRAVARADAQSGTGLPMWNYSVVAGQDGQTYQGSIVGRNPYFNGHRSTTISAYVVPVVLHYGSTVFDPTANDPCLGDSVIDLVANSPIFQSTDFTFTDSNGQNGVDVGVTQFGDATQRANFWNGVVNRGGLVLPYHTLLSYNQLPAVQVTVPSGKGYVNYNSCPYGMLDYNWWDNYVTTTLIPSLASQGVGANNLPIFLFDSIAMYGFSTPNSPSDCCYLADHGSYVNSGGQLQTYIVSDVDTSGYFPQDPDISVFSHEVGEWMNDPNNANPTPAWGTNGACENTYEVGDLLTGYTYPIKMPNGFTYNPQELVYFSWFFDQVPSIGAGRWYSDQGTLTQDSGPACQGATSRAVTKRVSAASSPFSLGARKN